MEQPDSRAVMRPASLDEVRVVCLQEAHLPSISHFSEREWSRPSTPEFYRWRYVESLPLGTTFVALRDDECLGTVTGLRKPYVLNGAETECLEVFDWHVLPAVRGAGVGVRLMRAMMRLGARLLSIGGTSDSTRAMTAMGWQSLGEAVDFVLPLSGDYLEARLIERLGVRVPGQEAAMSAVAATWFRPRPRAFSGRVTECSTLDGIESLYEGPAPYACLQRPEQRVAAWVSRGRWSGRQRIFRFAAGAEPSACGWTIGRLYETDDGIEAAIVEAFATQPGVELYEWMISETAAELAESRPRVIRARATCPLLQAALRENRFVSSGSATVHTWPKLPASALHVTLNHADAPLRPYRLCELQAPAMADTGP